MAQRIARMLFFVSLAGLAFGLVGWYSPQSQAPDARPARLAAPPRPTERTVLLGGDLEGEDLVLFTTATEAPAPESVVLLDSIKFGRYTHAYLDNFHPDHLIPVGPFPDGMGQAQKRIQAKFDPSVGWEHGTPHELWKLLFPRAENVVVAPAEPRGQFLQAACLAGVLKAPLFVAADQPYEAEDLRHQLAVWQTSRVWAVGTAASLCKDLGGMHVTHLADESAVATAYLRQQAARGPIDTLVIANPRDLAEEHAPMSGLAPWVALHHRAVLLLTNPEGKNVEELVTRALGDSRLKQVENIILVAGLEAIPTVKRPNPVPGDKDPEIEMEPLTPSGTEPFSFAVGRMFHDDPSVVLMLQARQRLLAERTAPPRALVASNPGGGLPLLEVFSRNTAKELGNAGYQTTGLFYRDVDQEALRRLWSQNDLVLWEGHHNTLVKEWGMPDWDEPMAPALVFLQSCLALAEWKALPLLNRGAIGVVGSSTRTYSGTGGACSLAFFDALVYDNLSVGGSLRQAKNFLLAYSLLKEKRLGEEAKRSGANVRSAWAFTLWGDPTLRLPPPPRPDGALTPVCHEVHGNTITVTLPDRVHDKVVTSKYQVQMPANARLAGLIRKEMDDDGRPLVPFVFAEVHLPKAPAGMVPHVTSRLASSHYVFCWDARRRCGYLLITPRAHGEKELQFHVAWEARPDNGAAAGQ